MAELHGPWGSSAPPEAVQNPNDPFNRKLASHSAEEQTRKYGYLLLVKPQTFWRFIWMCMRVGVFFALVSMGWSLSIVGNVHTCGVLSGFLVWINVLTTVGAFINLAATFMENTRHSVKDETLLNLMRYSSLALYLALTATFLINIGAFFGTDCSGSGAGLFKVYIVFGLAFNILLIIVGGKELGTNGADMDEKKNRENGLFASANSNNAGGYGAPAGGYGAPPPPAPLGEFPRGPPPSGSYQADRPNANPYG